MDRGVHVLECWVVVALCVGEEKRSFSSSDEPISSYRSSSSLILLLLPLRDGWINCRIPSMECLFGQLGRVYLQSLQQTVLLPTKHGQVAAYRESIAHDNASYSSSIRNLTIQAANRTNIEW